MSKASKTRAAARAAGDDTILTFSWRDVAPRSLRMQARPKVDLGPELTAEYIRLFLSCEIDAKRFDEVRATAAKIVAKRAEYEAVEKAIGVPWFFTGIVHSLEAGLNFRTHLHNGDPLSARTVQVPAGRPASGKPPFTWIASAIDALTLKGLDKWTDWTIAGILYQFERYNGFGYRLYHTQVLSPYLWSFTRHYTKGKYAYDGKWDSSLVSRQCGAAALLKILIEKHDVALRALPVAAPAVAAKSAADSVTGSRVAKKIGRKLDAFPDRIDLRDWFYRPHLRALPDELVNIPRVPLILDQGQEGACTGFALAAVINFLLHEHGSGRTVSARMLYEMARRYDEWPGEDYEGSSARGAMKGWVSHGVCLADTWPPEWRGPGHLTTAIGAEANRTPGGAYYRVKHSEIRDMHAALAETGVLYITLMVHAGWDEPGLAPGLTKKAIAEVTLPPAKSGEKPRKARLPIIQRQGRSDGGHAVAIVGYTKDGFIVQNSWGPGWGWNGFALLPYEDYLLHAVDVWVAQIGVPVQLKNWQPGSGGEEGMGMQRALEAVPLDEIRPFIINLGNNGRLSGSGNYWTTEEDIDRLFTKEIPRWTEGWSKKRILLYLHGGLNSETDGARRALAYRDVCLRNEIYPLFVLWETGEKETILDMLGDIFARQSSGRAGDFADYWRKTRDSLVEAKDWSLELTAAFPGTLMWDEMKENAMLASTLPDGGMRIVVEKAIQVLAGGPPARLEDFEMHVVGHSAGSIIGAHALDLLLQVGIPLKTLQFMAPARASAGRRPPQNGRRSHPDGRRGGDFIGEGWSVRIVFFESGLPRDSRAGGRRRDHRSCRGCRQPFTLKSRTRRGASRETGVPIPSRCVRATAGNTPRRFRGG